MFGRFIYAVHPMTPVVGFFLILAVMEKRAATKRVAVLL